MPRREWVATPEFRWALYFLITLFGAAAMHVFSLNKGFSGSVEFLRKVSPGRQQVFYDRLDAIIVVFAGALIGSLIFSPSNTPSALAAGFGWVGAINTLMSQRSK